MAPVEWVTAVLVCGLIDESAHVASAEPQARGTKDGETQSVDAEKTKESFTRNSSWRCLEVHAGQRGVSRRGHGTAEAGRCMMLQQWESCKKEKP